VRWIGEILTALTPDTIVNAIEANLSAYYLPYSTLPGGMVHPEADVTWSTSGIPEPWFNWVVGAQFPHATEQRVATILAAIAARNLPILWHFRPTTGPTNLGTILRAHGLQQFADEPCMALDLQAMPEPPTPLVDFTIVQVRDADDLARWTAVWMAPIAEPTRQCCRSVYAQLGASPAAPWRYYLGLLDGVSVATVKLFYAAGVVGVQHLMTVPAARRRGIAAALVSHAIHQARLGGYRLAALTAMPVGYEPYRRLGFREYGRWGSYLWRPASGSTGVPQTASPSG